MTEPSIKVDNIGKRYRVKYGGNTRSNYKRLTETIVDMASAPLRRLRQIGKPMPENEEFWALRNVSFEIAPGESVGIIGRNGAGKSTLLKLISQITRPTEGRIELMGRVGSLLEVGTGFHPELTGRENIYLNGAILGMSRVEIDSKFDEIIDFSEVERFLDTPVKRYSSGMYTRLAFAVAAHLEPEIFVVDEVLAVGDVAFQRKCLGRMQDVANTGRTVLFVSHNMASISTLCDRTIWLDDGQIRSFGETSKIISEYLAADTGRYKVDLRNHKNRRGTHKLFESIELLSTNESVGTYYTGGSFGFEITCKVDPELARHVSLGLNLKDSLGVRLYSGHFNQYKEYQVQDSGKVVFRAFVENLPLNPGTYYLNIYYNNKVTDLDIIDDAISFEVSWDPDIPMLYPPPSDWGPVYVPIQWDVLEQELT